MAGCKQEIGEILAGAVSERMLACARQVFAEAPAEALVWWTLRRFRSRVVVTMHGEPADLVLLEMISRLDRNTPILIESFDDRGFDVNRAIEHFGLTVQPTGSARLPVRRAVDRDLFASAGETDEHKVWVTASREGERIAMHPRQAKLTVRPLVGWSDEAVEAHLDQRQLIPLLAR